MEILDEMAIFLGAAVLAVPLVKRLGFGSVLGYLAAGILIGPWGLRLISDVDRVLHLSELGVVLLLFIIGLELQISRLWVLRKPIFGLGGAQVIATTAALGGAAWLLGLPPAAAFVAGAGLAMSSTALVLQMLAEQGELTTAHGRSSFAILLFQDLAVIPLLALVPTLGVTPASTLLHDPWLAALQAIGAFAAVTVGGRYLLRPIFRAIAHTRIREVFTATALLVVIGTALLMQSAGLSMALGAFLAGVLLADSEYRHEIEAGIEPFKGLLLGLFFIAVGMAADLGLLVRRPLEILALVAALCLIKALLLVALGRAFGLAAPATLRLGSVLAQGGEFAFVLFTVALDHQVMRREWVDLLIVVVTLSMALTPVLYTIVARVLSWAAAAVPSRPYDVIESPGAPVIIAGFGRFGQIVGRILRLRRIPFTALDISPEQIDLVRRFGAEAYYGDAARLDLLRAARANRSRLLVIAIDDVEASLRVAELARSHFPDLTVYARARNRRHAYRLMDLGVRVITRELFYSSLKMAEQVLVALGFTSSKARETVQRFLEHDERTLRLQHAIYHDEEKLIQSAKEAAAELQLLFEADQETELARNADAAAS
jgi:glutathione-regulated potassium-efflux system ancillary protein KefC/glutathione-regulated potassium-efflux system protein KefB